MTGHPHDHTASQFSGLVARLLQDARAEAIDACARWDAAERLAALTGRLLDTDHPAEGLDDLDAALGDDYVARADLANAVDTLGLPTTPPWNTRGIDHH